VAFRAAFQVAFREVLQEVKGAGRADTGLVEGRIGKAGPSMDVDRDNTDVDSGDGDGVGVGAEKTVAFLRPSQRLGNGNLIP
jgi:hypothetical protein